MSNLPPKKPYFDLAKEAIITLKERGGSSLPAIKKYIATTYPSLTVSNVSIVYCRLLLELVTIYIH